MKHSSLALIILSMCAAFAVRPGALADEKQKEMEAAIATFQSKDFERAEQQFRALLQGKVSESTAGKARFNLGITLKIQKKYADAVKEFETILTSGVDDREPGENLMEEFMNYRYRSCLQIASCYEAQNDIPHALASVKLARDKFKYEAHCGTCAAQAKEGLDARLKVLEAKARKG